jgi:hypothetical protein
MLIVALSVFLTVSVGINVVNWLFWRTIFTRTKGHPELALQELLGNVEHLRGKVIVIDQFGKCKILMPHQLEWLKQQEST